MTTTLPATANRYRRGDIVTIAELSNFGSGAYDHPPVVMVVAQASLDAWSGEPRIWGVRLDTNQRIVEDGRTFTALESQVVRLHGWYNGPGFDWPPRAKVLEILDRKVSDFDDGYPRCPACGDAIDYCQGHGEIGDPEGFRILERHDADDHRGCDPYGCDVAGREDR